ncbi:MAG: hypothetical protein AB1465_04845 [Patescibacteria group bacterium]
MGGRREKNFPLLRPYPDQNDLENLRYKDPLFWRELQRLKNFAARVSSCRLRCHQIKSVAKILRDTFNIRGSSQEIIYLKINEALDEAQKFVRELIDRLPVRFRGKLESEGDVAEEEDFVSLLLKWQKYCQETENNGNGDSLVKIREYEARRLILFAIILFDLKTRAKKLQLNGASLQAITASLEKSFFDRGFSESKTIITFHNPDDNFRVLCWYFSDDLPDNLPTANRWLRREYELVFRRFSWQGKQYLVYFSCRNKTSFSHLLKMLRKDIRDAHASALDWRGFKLVFLDLKSLQAGLDKLSSSIFILPGVTWKLEDGRHFRETVNPYSGKRFRAKKFVSVLKGEAVEVVVEDLINHLNGIASLGEENHELYRLRQLVRSGLPLVFPEEIYGIDWIGCENDILDYYKKII